MLPQERADLVPAGAPSPSVGVGDALPDAELRDVAGDPVRLSALLGDAAAVLVLCRGPWYPSCSIALRPYQRDLLPALEEAADATGDVPFPTVLVVDHDRTVRFADIHVDNTTPHRGAHRARDATPA